MAWIVEAANGRGCLWFSVEDEGWVKRIQLGNCAHVIPRVWSVFLFNTLGHWGITTLFYLKATFATSLGICLFHSDELGMQKNIKMMFVRIRNNLKDKRAQIGWHKRNPATCPEYSLQIQLKFFSFRTKVNLSLIINPCSRSRDGWQSATTERKGMAGVQTSCPHTQDR